MRRKPGALPEGLAEVTGFGHAAVRRGGHVAAVGCRSGPEAPAYRRRKGNNPLNLGLLRLWKFCSGIRNLKGTSPVASLKGTV